MSTLDAENFPSIPADEVERMEEVATAAEGLSFDDLATGEIPVRGVRVASTPRLAEPVPYAAVAGLAGTLPDLRPVRHRKGDGDDVYRFLYRSAVAVGVWSAIGISLFLMGGVVGGALLGEWTP